MKIGLVLMASGLSGRFGSNKLLARVGGDTLAERALRLYRPTRFARAVAVSQYDEVLDLAAEAGFLPVPNLEPEKGQSESIRIGLSFLKDCAGVLFAVCDQPWLTWDSVRRVLDAFQARPDAIAALSWRGERGNPVVFPRDLFPELDALRGDVGGGAVIRAHPERLLLVEAGDPRELRDVDRPEDLTT